MSVTRYILMIHADNFDRLARRVASSRVAPLWLTVILNGSAFRQQGVHSCIVWLLGFDLPTMTVTTMDATMDATMDVYNLLIL